MTADRRHIIVAREAATSDDITAPRVAASSSTAIPGSATAATAAPDAAASTNIAIPGSATGNATGARAAGSGVVLAAGVTVSGIVAVQAGASVAADLFGRISPTGVVFLRQSIAALVLCLWRRPRLGGLDSGQWRSAVVFGVVLAGMNCSMYQAIARMPLALAVTIELLGPLALSVVLAGRRVDLLWSAMAVAGVLLLRFSSIGRASAVGMVFAVLAAAGWATYLVLAERMGDRFEGVEGVTLALGIAAVITGPIALAENGARLLAMPTIGRGFVVALLSAVAPFCCDAWAIRRLRAHAMSLLNVISPAIAALIGGLILDQPVTPPQALGITIVIAAALGTLSLKRRAGAKLALDPGLD